MKFSAVLVMFLGLAAAADVQADSQAQIKSAIEGPCVYLDETQDELDYQVDMFSRTLDSRHWTNVQNIAKAMKKAGKKPKNEGAMKRIATGGGMKTFKPKPPAKSEEKKGKKDMIDVKPSMEASELPKK